MCVVKCCFVTVQYVFAQELSVIVAHCANFNECYIQ